MLEPSATAALSRDRISLCSIKKNGATFAVPSRAATKSRWANASTRSSTATEQETSAGSCLSPSSCIARTSVEDSKGCVSVVGTATSSLSDRVSMIVTLVS